MGIIVDNLPDFNTLTGFFLYSSVVYGFILFMGWLAQPTLEESVKQEIE